MTKRISYPLLFLHLLLLAAGMLSSGAGIVRQSEVPASITSIFFFSFFLVQSVRLVALPVGGELGPISAKVLQA